MEKVTKRIWKFALFYLFLVLTELGIWFILRSLMINLKWPKLHITLWVGVCLVLFILIVKHIGDFFVLLVDPLFSWWRRHLEEKREFKKKLEEIDREFKEYFESPNSKWPEK